MNNFTYYNHERELELQKEIYELREENTLLKGIISDYREGLVGTISESQNRMIIEEKEIIEVPTENKVSLPAWKLTNSEREVLNILVLEKGKVISRHNLAVEIWGNSDSPSYMTRLSTIIRNIKSKLRIEDEDQDVIRTNWGEGYQLTKVFFDYYEIDANFIEEYAKAQ